MPSATVMVLLKSVRVINNGDTPDLLSAQPKPASVGIISSLLFPNGMQAAQTNQVVASVTVPTLNSAKVNFDLTDPYNKGNGPEIPLQFKIIIDDQSPLNVELDYTAHADLFLTILSSVIGALGGTLAAAAPGGSFVTAGLNSVIGFFGDKLKKASGDQVQPIGQGSVRITVAQLTAQPQDFTVQLTAPSDVFRSWFKPNPSPATQNNTPFVADSGNVISKGQANGEVVFSVYRLN